jgi:hypothetical protein
MKTYNEFNDYIDLLASDYDGEQDIYDFCSEQADSSEYVIYYGKAWDLVNMIRCSDISLLDDAEASLEYATFESIYQTMSLLTYEIIYQQLLLAVEEKVEAA